MVEHAKAPTLEEVKWREVREAVAKVNPAFASIIDKINPGDKFPLYRAKYPFGSTIIDKGRFYLPHNRSLVAIDDPYCPHDLRTKLGYNASSVPLSVVLNRSVELYLKPEGRIIPFSLITKGAIFGLWGTLSQPMHYTMPKAWNMMAGARTIFLLPKITDATSFKRLSKARGIKLPVPSNLFEHNLILKQMANHKDFPSGWFTEILFFPWNWFNESKRSEWINFRLFLYENAWKKTEYWRNKVVYDYIWHTFIKEITAKNTKILPHIIDIVEHIIKVGLGALPGFVPALDNESAPIEAFQNDFVGIYGLKYFSPTIMVPKCIAENDERYVYWSLQLPTYFETNPRPKTANSIISDLREIMNLLEKFRKAVLENKVPAILETPFYNFMKRTRFDFFHSDVEPEEEGIRASREMAKEDDTLIKRINKFDSRDFSEISPFVRGCVRIKLDNLD